MGWTALGTGILAALLSTFPRAQEVKPVAVDDRETYAVYSSLLPNE